MGKSDTLQQFLAFIRHRMLMSDLFCLQYFRLPGCLQKARVGAACLLFVSFVPFLGVVGAIALQAPRTACSISASLWLPLGPPRHGARF
jgi:hypothetical protein